MEKHFRKREAIYRCLCSTDSHPTAEWIFSQLEGQGISLASVYRNLIHFQKEGRAISVTTLDGVEHFDGRVAPHPHFLCTQCGSIQDVSYTMPPLPEVEDLGQVQDYTLLYRGICKSCLNKNDIIQQGL